MENMFDTNINQLLQNTSGGVAGEDVFITLALTGVMAAIIYIAYRFAHSQQTYQGRFAVTLVVIAFVSTVLMDIVQTNLALSLGMLGSLSIVRFRTNIKDPRDIGFVIWSMAVGIAAATENYLIGIVGCLTIALVLILTRKSEIAVREMLLIIRGSDADLDNLQDIVNTIEGSRVKAKNILSDSFEIVYEVKVRDEESNNVIENIFEIGGVDSVNLLSQNNAV